MRGGGRRTRGRGGGLRTTGGDRGPVAGVLCWLLLTVVWCLFPDKGQAGLPALSPILPTHGYFLLQGHERFSLSLHLICVQVLESGGNE